MQELLPSVLTPLIGFALWAVLLAFLLAFARVGAMQRDKRAINTFKVAGDTAQLDRFSRAHLNALENLPIFAVVYLSAWLVQADAPVLALGWVILGARILQSCVHLNSASVPAVQLRAAMQLVQLISFAWLGIAAMISAN